MNEIDLDVAEAFEEDYRSAQAYDNRAEQFLNEGQSFSVVFNVASVALERYLVALCKLYGVEPRNHNYVCLMEDIEEIVDVPPELNKEIRSLDLIFGICSLENYHHGVPEPTDSQRVIAMCKEIKKLFNPTKMAAMRTAVKNNRENC